MTATGICEHLRPGQWPFRVELVLDEHLGPTDAVVACRHCSRVCLLEMLDWQGSVRVMRVAALDADQARSLIRDLTRGSCDVGRAGAQIQHLRTLAPFSRQLLLVDTNGPSIENIASLPDDLRLPGASWRELPCDGALVDYVRSLCERQAE